MTIPGLGWRFGLDSILGLIPGIGDVLTAMPALYIVLHAQALGAPATLVVRMLINVLIDAAIGSVPVLGDLFDVAFKANRRNVALLRNHLG